MPRTGPYTCFVLILLVAGCELPFGASSENEIATGFEKKDQVTIEPGLEAQLLGPELVAAGDSFRVRFHLKNITTSTIRFRTGGCWGRPAVFSGEERVPMVGSLQVCTLELLHWKLSAGAERTRDFDLKATMNASMGSPKVVGPAEPGTYTLQAKLDWTIYGQKIDKRLEGELEVVSGQ